MQALVCLSMLFLVAVWFSLSKYYHNVLCIQEALRDLQTFADSWKHFVGYVQIMLPYQLLRQVTTVSLSY